MKGRLCVALVFFVAGIVFQAHVLETGHVARAGGAAPACRSGDLNGDGHLNVTDAVHLLQYLFELGPAPDDGCAPATVVFVVRHAERTGADLNETGRARARELATLFADMDLDALVASDEPRTQQTLQPLLDSKEDVAELLITASRDGGVEAAAAIRALPAGSRVVMAHHSFSVGGILEKLGAVEETFNIPFSEYDNLWVVTVKPGSDAQAVKLKYCVAPDCPVVEPGG
ncbi:MAG: histidine phosphatase family protein [Planctomycetota bacterium]|nr:histidine phosphatase family protein [Planctomycetota bacterium]